MNSEILEAVPNTFPSLFWGYAFLWLVICLYMLVLNRKVARALESKPDSGSKHD